MKRIDIRILMGTILIGAGILFLLQTLNILSNVWGIILILSFLIGSGIFFYVYLTDRRHWWSLIPAATLLGLAGTIFADTYIPGLSNLGGSVFLFSIGLSFWVIYLTNLEFWWAIIPGGVLITLGFVTIAENMIRGDSEAGVFFLGLAITFLLVAILAKPRENFWWAYIPAGILFILGIFFIGQIKPSINYLWPIILIIIGGIILIRNIRKA